MSLRFTDKLAALPLLLSTVEEKDPMVHMRFFAPWNNWAWYVVAGERELPDNFQFFGWIVGWKDEDIPILSLEDIDAACRTRGAYLTDAELDSQALQDVLDGFTLSILQEIRGPDGRTVERDRHFKACRLSEVRRLYTKGGPYEGHLWFNS